MVNAHGELMKGSLSRSLTSSRDIGTLEPYSIGLAQSSYAGLYMKCPRVRVYFCRTSRVRELFWDTTRTHTTGVWLWVLHFAGSWRAPCVPHGARVRVVRDTGWTLRVRVRLVCACSAGAVLVLIL